VHACPKLPTTEMAESTVYFLISKVVMLPTPDLSGIRGWEVSANSGIITWPDGHISILPMIRAPGSMTNLCDEVDIPLIKFMAKFLKCMTSSRYVLHLSSSALNSPWLLQDIGDAFSRNQCMCISGVPLHSSNTEVSTQLLDICYGISLARQCIYMVHTSLHSNI
jgi:hypothetical protein